MMSSNRRKFVVRHPVIVDIGCSCRKPKLLSFFSSSSSSLLPKLKTPKSPNPFSPSSTTTTTPTTSISNWETSLTATSTTSSDFETPKKMANRKNGKKKKGVVEESVAVVKESSDPYLDFRDSMLQMIVEKEIYAWEDLRELLHRFLSLNSPHHHHLILRAFAEIWNGVFSPPIHSPSGWR